MDRPDKTAAQHERRQPPRAAGSLAGAALSPPPTRPPPPQLGPRHAAAHSRVAHARGPCLARHAVAHAALAGRPAAPPTPQEQASSFELSLPTRPASRRAAQKRRRHGRHALDGRRRGSTAAMPGADATPHHLHGRLGPASDGARRHPRSHRSAAATPRSVGGGGGGGGSPRSSASATHRELRGPSARLRGSMVSEHGGDGDDPGDDASWDVARASPRRSSPRAAAAQPAGAAHAGGCGARWTCAATCAPQRRGWGATCRLVHAAGSGLLVGSRAQHADARLHGGAAAALARGSGGNSG